MPCPESSRLRIAAAPETKETYALPEGSTATPLGEPKGEERRSPAAREIFPLRLPSEEKTRIEPESSSTARSPPSGVRAIPAGLKGGASLGRWTSGKTPSPWRRRRGS